MSANIPIKNIYHLLSYAWDILPRSQNNHISVITNEDFQSKLIGIFIEQTNTLIKSGLGKMYIATEEELSVVKGKIAWKKSAISLGLRNTLICIHDEYSEDHELNQIIKATLTHLCKVKNLNEDQHKQIKRSLEHFSNVSIIKITPDVFSKLTFNNLNKKKYFFICKLAEMIFNNLMPTENEGEYIFIDFSKDERKMRELFEKFVHNFFKIKLSNEAKIKREELDWDFTVNGQTSLLPKMYTDTSIKYKNRVIVIETKFTPKMFESNYRSSKLTLNSKHLYQLSSYLNNYNTNLPLTGMLLYPSTGKKLRASFESKSYNLKVMTVDLSKEWQTIESELLEIIAA